MCYKTHKVVAVVNLKMKRYIFCQKICVTCDAVVGYCLTQKNCIATYCEICNLVQCSNCAQDVCLECLAQKKIKKL